MTRSRIAVFEGYGRPSRYSRYGGQIVANPKGPLSRYSRYGGQIVSSPRPAGEAGAFGRRGYYVPPIEESMADPYRKAYRVKAKRNTPAMKRQQNKFKKAAKKCAKRRSGSFKVCMRKALKGKR